MLSKVLTPALRRCVTMNVRTVSVAASRLRPPSTSATWLSNPLSFAAPEESEAAYIQSLLPTGCNLSLIPRTLQEVFHSPQACVVTTLTAPHKIVAVNDAWTKLCGYTQAEVHHQTLSSILHGPKTNEELVNATMERVRERVVPSAVMAQNLEDMYVLNYNKQGSSFINHVTISKLLLSDDQPEQQFLLGVLEAVPSAPLRMA
jgi:PAS domain S-box-containing protein